MASFFYAKNLTMNDATKRIDPRGLVPIFTL